MLPLPPALRFAPLPALRWRHGIPLLITLLHGLALLAFAARQQPTVQSGREGALMEVLADTPPAPPSLAPAQPSPVEPRPERVAQPRPVKATAPTREAVIHSSATDAALDAPSDSVAPPEPPQPAAAPQAATAPSEALAQPTPPSFDAAYLNNRRPLYPPLSQRLGEQGRVVLRVRVEADGRPSQIELFASSGHGRLDEAAIAAVREWTFVPAKRGGEAIAEWVRVPIPFVLR